MEVSLKWSAAEEKVLRDLQERRARACGPLKEWLRERALAPTFRPGLLVPGLDLGYSSRQEAADHIFRAISEAPLEMQELLRPFLGDS